LTRRLGEVVRQLPSWALVTLAALLTLFALLWIIAADVASFNAHRWWLAALLVLLAAAFALTTGTVTRWAISDRFDGHRHRQHLKSSGTVLAVAIMEVIAAVLIWNVVGIILGSFF
jgi:hypothetical protein